MGAVGMDVLVVQPDERRQQEDGQQQRGGLQQQADGPRNERGDETSAANVDADEDLIDLHRAEGRGRRGGRMGDKETAAGPATVSLITWSGQIRVVALRPALD